VQLRPMSRYNLGTEVRLGSDITASGGVLYNPSAVVPGGSTANGNYYGVTGGAAVTWERTRFTAGAFYLWANEILSSAPAELSAAAYGGMISVGYLL